MDRWAEVSYGSENTEFGLFNIIQPKGAVALTLVDPTQTSTLIDESGNLRNDPIAAAAAAVEQAGKVRGTIADGTSMLLVVAHTNEPTVRIEVHSLEAGGRPLGTFTTVDGSRGGADLTIETVPSSARPGYSRAAVAVFSPTDVFPSGSGSVIAWPVNFLVRTSPTGPSPTPSNAYLNVARVVKPPIVLVHGRHSDATTWSEGFIETLQQYGYRSTSVTPPQRIYIAEYGPYSNQGFDPTPVPVGAAVLYQQYIDAVNGLRAAGFAGTTVDVVGHSMGGLIARAFVQQGWYKAVNPYNRGAIRRLVTMGTPHLGSKMAPYIDNYNTIFGGKGWLPGTTLDPKQALVDAMLNVSGEAVKQLIPGSDAYWNLTETCVPSHAIVGTYLPDLATGLAGVKMFTYEATASLILVMPGFGGVHGMANDTVVDVVSQAGGLSGAHVTLLPSVIHNKVDGLFYSEEPETRSSAAAAVAARVLAGPGSAFANCLPAPALAAGWTRSSASLFHSTAAVASRQAAHVQSDPNIWRQLFIGIRKLVGPRTSPAASVNRLSRLGAVRQQPLRLQAVGDQQVLTNPRLRIASPVAATRVLHDGGTQLTLQAIVSGVADRVFFLVKGLGVIDAPAPHFTAEATLGPGIPPGPLMVVALASVDGLRAEDAVTITVEPTQPPSTLMVREGTALTLTDASAVQTSTKTGQPTVWLRPAVTYTWSGADPIDVNSAQGVTYEVVGAQGIVRVGANGELVGLRTGTTLVRVAFGPLTTDVDVTVTCRETGGACVAKR